ncbi:trypsin-like [Atheta coriaria]|uniref:trypsin-like n=1 Tax=Dalotia coriaria TaxID=877792 RepID=UPI0031F35019
MFKTSAIVILLLGVCHAQPTRIVGGEDADITEVPWQVSLQRSLTDFHFCGGTILSSKWILTAGHCMDSDPSPTDIQVVVGMTKKSEGGVVHTVKQSIQHPLYSSMIRNSHDMTLLELNEPIEFNERAQPVRIPTDDETLPVGELATIQGWGRLWQDGDSPDQLQKTTLPIWEPEACASPWSFPLNYFVGPDAPFICAAWDNAMPNTCNGDSGGALTYSGIQYGVVSFGMGCVNPAYPKVFTNVYNLRGFIYDNTDLLN